MTQEINDSLMTQEATQSSILRLLLVGASLVVILAGMKAASALLSPILLALIIAAAVTPLMGWMQKRGLPAWLTMLLTLALLIVVLVGFILLVGSSISQLVGTLPQYQEGLQAFVENLATLLQRLGIDTEGKGLFQLFDPGAITGLLGSVFGSVMSALSGVGLMLIVLIFVLLSTPHVADQRSADSIADNPALVRFNQLVKDLRGYVGITTLINFAVAVVNFILLVILGVDFALLWGILSFVLGYIPAVGFWLALIPPFFLALAQFGIGKALIVLVGYVVINGGIQSFIQPKVMGASVNLSPLVITLSLVLWSWILGPMGALLAVPMTMIVKDVVLAAYDDTRALTRLLGTTRPSADAPPESSAS
jgi:AI-2 transport protein TqsA